MITLTNDWHGSTTRIRAKIGDLLNEDQVKRIGKCLCSITDCGCSDDTGTRGDQDYGLNIVEIGDRGLRTSDTYRVVARKLRYHQDNAYNTIYCWTDMGGGHGKWTEVVSTGDRASLERSWRLLDQRFVVVWGHTDIGPPEGPPSREDMARIERHNVASAKVRFNVT